MNLKRRAFFHTKTRCISIYSWHTKEMPHFSETILDIFFPPKCLNCSRPRGQGNPSGLLCFNCQTAIQIHDWVFCPVCHQKLPSFGRCPRHKHQSKLAFLGIASDYGNPLVRKLIWSFKYEFLESLAEPLAEILRIYFEKAFPKETFEKESFEFLAIPLHPRRERWRGFNQAEVLARSLGRKINLTVRHGLERPIWRKPQMEIGSRKERILNTQGIFRLAKGANFQNKNIILIDDVLTSGATLQEAAKTLKSAGAKSVIGLVIAKG